MRLIEILSHTNKQPLTEAYVSSMSEHVDEDMARHFAKHRKLTGNLKEDVAYLTEFQRLFEEDEDFDPFSHLVKTDKIIPEKDCVLTFSTGNDKLQKLSITAFDLPAGYTCPFAQICKTFAHKKGGRFNTGKAIKQTGDVRCYAASTELRSPAARKMRWRNFDLLRKYKRDPDAMADLILNSMDFHETQKPKIRVLRIHSAGDFWSQEYFDAWLRVASGRDDVLFYAYTKALPYWQKRKDSIPGNMRLIASEGGTTDELIDKEQFRRAVIVKDAGEAIKRKLKIDINDFLAALGDEDFALILHGPQAAGISARQSKMNSEYIRKVSKQFGVDPKEFEKLLAFYTGGARKRAAAASQKRQQQLQK